MDQIIRNARDWATQATLDDTTGPASVLVTAVYKLRGKMTDSKEHTVEKELRKSKAVTVKAAKIPVCMRNSELKAKKRPQVLMLGTETNLRTKSVLLSG